MNIFALRNQFDRKLKQNLWKPAGLSSTGAMTSLLDNDTLHRNSSIDINTDRLNKST